MWEFARSLLTFSWVMSLFGFQQMINLLALSRATRAFDDVASAAEAELGHSMQTALRTGNALLNAFTGRQPGLTWRPSGARNHPVFSAEPLVDQKETPAGTQGKGWEPVSRHTPNSTSSASAPRSFAESGISEEYPYEARYVEVFGSRMHYIEQGTGDPILLLHGNPTWSYLWRNVIPHLSPLGRCIAPDLIGYGRSDKPDIGYRWFDHVKYLEEFIRVMGLRNITLVLHDHGSGLGFHYAMRHEHNVRAIAFFEAIVRPYPWDQFSSPEFRELFRKFRSGGPGGEGWQMLVERNMFIEELLPLAAGRKLTEREMNFYREPFPDPQSRTPIWTLARETPIGGEPADVWKAVAAYSDRLQSAKLPKLMLYFTPGALLTAENVEWCRRNIRNLESVDLGPGLHFVQESSPHRIGGEIASWLKTLGSEVSTQERLEVRSTVNELRA
jgi:haloalkane dehalogenase